MDFEPSEEKESYADQKETPDVAAKVMAIIEQLKPLAEAEGCTVSELVEKHSGEEEEEEPEDDGSKVDMVAARMKAKRSSEEMES